MDINKVMLQMDLLSIIVLKFRSRQALRNTEMHNQDGTKDVLFEHYDEYTLGVLYSQLDQLEKLLGNTFFDKIARRNIMRISNSVIEYLNDVVKARTGGLVLALPAKAKLTESDEKIIFDPNVASKQSTKM